MQTTARMVSGVGVLLLAGCAASGGTGMPAAEPAPRVEDASDGVRYELALRGVSHKSQIAAPAEKVWDALLQTYGALEIPADLSDPGNRRYGVRRYTAPRMAGRRTDDLLRCSEGAGPSAVVARRIEMSVISSLRAVAADRTELETEVTGLARRMDGTSTPPVRCESLGVLEQRIAAGVKERAAP